MTPTKFGNFARYDGPHYDLSHHAPDDNEGWPKDLDTGVQYCLFEQVFDYRLDRRNKFYPPILEEDL